MKKTPNSFQLWFTLRFSVYVVLICLGLAARHAAAANSVWTGDGSDAFWTTAANWAGDTVPGSGSSLFFGGTSHLANTNNFAVGTAFDGITFTTPAGAFAVAGNTIDLGGNITNDQVVTLETLNTPLVLTVPVTADVVPNGATILGGALSGAGSLTVAGGGSLTLSGANTFAGGFSVDGSTAIVGADTNLGPGTLTLDEGVVEATASFTLDANRGIAVGPGWGDIFVATGDTLSYGGVIANNGSMGGLVKSGYGTLDLYGAEAYSGPTTNAIGTIILDYTQPSSPTANIINSSSSLELGGGNAGGGVENVAELHMAGGGAADSQAFPSTFSTFGGSAIVATNGSGGSANLSLGALSHAPGGTVTFVTPSSGQITTTAGNINGILGGWALMSGNSNAATIYTDTDYAGVEHFLLEGTNFCMVNLSGDIVNFTGYTNVTAAGGTLNSQITGSPAPPNVTINDTSSATVVTVDNSGAGSTSDVNAINWTTSSGGFDGIYIGSGNTLRLGQYGGIIRNGPSTGNAVYVGGSNNSLQSGNGNSGVGNIGTLTAGGPNANTPGEIVIVANNASETSGTTIFESVIADNGTGPVTVVKMGPGSIKLDGSNTFSGGLYLLQGRVQFAGSEIGNSNPDGGGSGPIYVLPGAYLFPSGIGSGVITNSIFVAGYGDAHENYNAIRGGAFSGTITLIGDAEFADGVTFNGPIVGPFNVLLGSEYEVNGSVTLNNAGDAWTGDTTMTARNNTGANTVVNGTNNVIPSGFGYGNVIMSGYSSGTIAWNLNGFDQTINGLSSTNTTTTISIENTVASTTSTLTIGDNDQSGTFGGIIENGGGTTALTKIGGGIETLTGINTYTGPTTVSEGTLALTGSGSISDSAIQVNTNGTLDVSGLSAGIATTQPVGLNGGTFIGGGSVGALGTTNGAFTFNVSPSTLNLTAASLATGGMTNLINITTVYGISGYPVTIPMIKYSGSLGGSGNNFGIGTVPNADTIGYVSNDVTHSEIVLVLLNGPKVLTWTGTNPVNPTYWDVDTTTNWIAFKGTAGASPSAFNQADSPIFDDTGSGTVSVQAVVEPGVMEVTNNAVTYTFTGPDNISGLGNVTKAGTGTMILDNGASTSLSVSGVLNLNSGTIQMGNNDTKGAISAPKGVVDDGSLVFDQSGNMTSSINISGTGSLSQVDTNTLTLSGNSTFSGGATVAAGTVRTASGTALGSGTATIASGATLDVDGQTVTNDVFVAGAGVGGNGAIYNSGAASENAMLDVTMTADTYFGGTGRWDIRGTGASLSTSSNPYNLFKVGANQVSLVDVSVDPALANITVEGGIFSIQESSTSLGNSSDTLTVNAGATLDFYADTTYYTKVFDLNGNGVATTLSCSSGIGNTISDSPFTLNGTCVFSPAAATTLIFLSDTLGGSGAYLQTGAGTNIFAVNTTASYTGGTIVSNGTLCVDGSLSGNVQVDRGAELAGTGTASGSVTVQAGTVAPGDPDSSIGNTSGTLTAGTLTLSNATVLLSLDTTPTASDNDTVAATSGLTVIGTNTLEIAPLSFMSVGNVYTLINYGGATLPSTATNQLKVVSTKPFFSFSVVDPSTTPGTIQIKVLTAVGNDIWTGAYSSTWDLVTTNWTRNSNPVTFITGDVANFDGSSSVTSINVSGLEQASGINVSASQVISFLGSGSISNVGPLNVTGNELIIDNSGTDSFPGTITVADGSTLQVGNDDTNGSLGLTAAAAGLFTNNGTLLLDRSDSALVLSNIITGGFSGAITNIGTGTVTLAGANTFEGNVTVQSGTLAANNNTALGNATLASTYVDSGASLGIASQTVSLGAVQIYASGSGVGGQGAIVDNTGSSTYVGAAGTFYNLTLLGNTTVGGSGRMDMRNSTATPSLSTGGQPYNLTKVGTALFQTVNVDVDLALANIYVENGTFGLQGTYLLGFGDTSSNFVVTSGGDLDMYELSEPPAIPFVKGLIIENGGIASSSSGNSYWDGPVTLAGGTNIFKLNSGDMYLEAGISGPGDLETEGSATLTVTNEPVTYTGNTILTGGTLALQGTANITNSPVIYLGGATLSANGTIAGDFELVSGQSLFNGGTIVGPLLADAASLVNPGAGTTTATVTDTNSITLNGKVVMDLNQSNAQKADEMVSPSITANGTLVVTNLGPDLGTGTKFQLFSTPLSGSYSVSLPLTSASGAVSYTWQNNLAVNGSITLISGAPDSLTPAKIKTLIANGNITLTWPTNQIGWTLQMQTNSLSVGISTNWVAVPNSTETNQLTLPATNGLTFFRLTFQP